MQDYTAISAPEFDLAASLECGQVFHWRREGEGWLGLIGETPVYIAQRGETLTCPAGTERLVSEYFALDHPLAGIRATFPDDPAMQAASAFCCGMRIIRQPAWECLATFITSAMKQVAHIRQMSHALRRNFGTPARLGSAELFAYPAAERIAELDETALRGCGLGFRAKNLLATARMVASREIDLDAIASLDDEAAFAGLCRCPGVGEKVANCVLLFGFGRLRAFPIDVWIERVLREIYFKKKRKVTAQRLRSFSREYFGAFGGYAQQYLFHHARLTWRARAGRIAA